GARAMVDRLRDGGRGDPRRGDVAVESPADVLCPGTTAVRPPGVLIGLVVQAPEDVDEADLVEDAGEPGTLLGQETRVLLVRAPVAQIDLLVRDVPVAAQDDFLPALAQPLEVQQELLQETEFRRLAMRPRRARGQIDGDEPQVAEARLDIAPFGVELTTGEAAPHFIGSRPAVERATAVALLPREGMAALEELEAMELGVEVGLVAFQLLQADDVRLLRGEPAEESLLCRRTDAVDVERYYSQPAGKADTPPCSADHFAGSCRKRSTSASCVPWR